MFLFSSNLFAQYTPLPILQKILNSELIIEGEVVSKTSFKKENTQEIYTNNLIKIEKTFKGSTNESIISIITYGGELEGEIQTWSHLPSFEMNQNGIFFLNSKTNKENTMILDNLDSYYDIYSGSQGFYQINSSSYGVLGANSIIDRYQNIKYFYKILGYNDSNIENKNPSDNCLQIKIVPKSYNVDNLEIEADVFVKIKIGEKKAYKISINAIYNNEIFGKNIVASKSIFVSNGDFPSTEYELISKDISENSFEILLKANTTNYSDLKSINSDYVKIANVKLNIIGFSTKIPIEWGNSINLISNYYVDEDNYIKEFDCTETNIGNACNIKITEFTPKIAAAGVGNNTTTSTPGIITITGSGFSNPDKGELVPAGYRVNFTAVSNAFLPTNKDDVVAPLEGDYLKWTDNEIILKVPSVGYSNNSMNIPSILDQMTAATGKIQICKDERIGGFLIPCNCKDDSKSELLVPFAARNEHKKDNLGNEKSIRVLLRDMDRLGGFTIFFDNTIKNITGSMDAFERSLKTWQCRDEINFKLDKINPPNLQMPGACLIRTSNLPVGTTTTLAATSTFPEDCDADNPLSKILYYSPNFLMSFNSNLNWYTGINKKTLNTGEYDMESIAVHELGHAQLLNHTLNTTNRLFPINSGSYLRTIDNNDLDGGIYVSQFSNKIQNTLCKDVLKPMKLLKCILTNTIESIEENIFIYPNPLDNELNIILKKNMKGELIFRNIIGKNVKKLDVNDNELHLSLNDLNSGVYFLFFETENFETKNIGKIIKQ